MENLTKLDAARGTSFFPTFLSTESLTDDGIQQILGMRLSEVFSVIKNDDEEYLFFYTEEWNALCMAALERLRIEEKFGGEVERALVARSSELKKFVDSLTDTKIRAATNKELMKIIDEFCVVTKSLRIWGWIPNLVNFHEQNIVDVTLAELKKNKNIPEEVVQPLFAKLTTPTRLLEQNKANDALLEIVDAKKAGQKIDELLRNYLVTYGYLTYHYKGPTMSQDDLMQIVVERSKNKGAEKRQRFSERRERVEAEQRMLKEQYRIRDDLWRSILEIQRMTYLKAYRKEVLIYSNFKMSPVLEEIALRIKKEKSLVRCLLVDEMRAALSEKRMVSEQELNERRRELITVASDGTVCLLKDKAKKKALLEQLVEKKEICTVIKGQCAFPGCVRGIVKIVEKKEDMKNFNEGDILVSRSTNPDLLFAMEKAAAIVTDIGGISCHAAIVSRELEKPCIIGTKCITAMVRDGMLIEVDANNGTVTVIN